MTNYLCIFPIVESQPANSLIARAKNIVINKKNEKSKVKSLSDVKLSDIPKLWVGRFAGVVDIKWDLLF